MSNYDDCGTGDQKVHEAMKHFGDLTDQARYYYVSNSQFKDKRGRVAPWTFELMYYTYTWKLGP
jgi:hypothetical protein